MKSHYLFLLALTLFGRIGFSQNIEIENLTNKITAGKINDSLKMRAIFEFVAKSIEYDVKLYEKSLRKNVEEFAELQQPTTVLAEKRAVCMGYAMLFKAMCTAANIRTEMISGYAKHIDFETDKHYVSEVFHAWNAVQLNGKWYLLDPTWASGSVNDGQFYREFNEEFYLSDPKDFIKRHLPFDPVWQLIDKPLSVKEFRLYKEWPPSRPELPVFNFVDSLKTHFTLEEDARKLNSYIRALKYDPSNEQAKRLWGIISQKRRWMN